MFGIMLQTERERLGGQINRLMDRQTGRYTSKQIFRQTDIQTDRYTGEQIFRQTDIQADRQSINIV